MSSRSWTATSTPSSNPSCDGAGRAAARGPRRARRTRTRISRRSGPRGIAASALLIAALLRPGELGAQPASGPKDEPAWILGIARFSLSGEDGASASIGDIIPTLILGRLASLPPRAQSAEEAREAAALAELRALFSAGAELASKLDARSSAFFDPASAPEARKPAIAKADSAVAESRKKLEALFADDGKGEGDEDGPDSGPRASRLWEGHARGELIDAKAGAAQAAKSSGVDLLVAGSIEIRSGYALATLRGYDRSLEREVFAWEDACSVEDPEPLAAAMAARLEFWVAGRDFARIEIRASPASARITVNGRELDRSGIAYIFDELEATIEAGAAGYGAFSEIIPLRHGERRALSIALSPLSLGSALVQVDPPGASLSLDSVPIGEAPLTIALDGTRRILSASAPGREGASLVLPESGDERLDIVLPLEDALGPEGRLEAARGGFYSSLGLLAISIPATALSIGARNVYAEAEARSPAASASAARASADIVVIAAAAGTAAAAVNMFFRLAKYLGAAR